MADTDQVSPDPFATAAAQIRAARAAAQKTASELTVKARLERINTIITDPDFQVNMDQLALLAQGVGGNVENICDNNNAGYELLLKQLPAAIAAQK